MKEITFFITAVAIKFFTHARVYNQCNGRISILDLLFSFTFFIATVSSFFLILTPVLLIFFFKS